ncbi:MAG: 3-ketoacyl-ACP reductase [Clostridia bacterium]|nr:3-ketoacyl-ACP reductase [Clostridia bacterium]
MMKIAVVTGGLGGIGFGIAKALTENGYTVVASDVAPRAAGEEKLQALGLAAYYIPCDISKTDDRAALLAETLEKFEKVDLLVNVAGVAPKVRMDILQTTEESFDFVMNINCKGTYFMCQAFANAMINRKNKEETPRIINIASLSSYSPSLSRGEYCISKAGVSMTTQMFAARLAEYGIPVFEVRPGIIQTNMIAPVNDKYAKMIENGLTPIRRFGQPEDVANVVLAAASGMLDFGTGTLLNADGGYSVRVL